MEQPIGGKPDGTRPSRVQRAIVARRVRPDGRALLGALLVTVAGVGAFALSSTPEPDPGATWLVVADDVAPGAILGRDDLATDTMVLSEAMEGLAFSSVDEAVGATALAPIAAGQVLVRNQIRLRGAAAPEHRLHRLTIPVELERTPVDLQVGDQVTILATSREAGTEVAADAALVTDISGSGDQRTLQITLGLESGEQVLRATDLSFRDLTVVLTGPGGISSDAPEDPR